ncbi:MAG: hypothetical protein HQM03_22175 [Magnetococcales bacterium]|nr:hypothetical protein [Magnetococcales bacterium]
MARIGHSMRATNSLVEFITGMHQKSAPFFWMVDWGVATPCGINQTSHREEISPKEPLKNYMDFFLSC